MFRKEKKEDKEFTREEIRDILAGVKELSEEELAKVFGGKGGDDRETFTLDPQEISNDIWGSKF